MLLKLFVTIFIIFLISSCATTPLYIQPQGKNTASMNFHNHGIGIGEAHIYKHYEYCNGRRTTDKIAVDKSLTVKVKAGQPLSFSLGYHIERTARGYRFCRARATFLPEVSMKYDVYIKPAFNGCKLEIYTNNNGIKEKVKFKPRRRYSKTPWNEDGAWCD